MDDVNFFIARDHGEFKLYQKGMGIDSGNNISFLNDGFNNIVINYENVSKKENNPIKALLTVIRNLVERKFNNINNINIIVFAHLGGEIGENSIKKRLENKDENPASEFYLLSRENTPDAFKMLTKNNGWLDPHNINNINEFKNYTKKVY